MRTSKLIAIIVVVAGCRSASDPRPVEPSKPADASLVRRIVEAERRMHERFAATAAIGAAIERGDMDRARTEARAIADLDEPGFLPEWQPYVASVRASAVQVTLAADPVAGARTFALLGSRCAQCHQAAAAKIVFPKVSGPRDDPKLLSQMAGHAWAAARMWEGMIGPSPSLWLEGAEALSGARLTIVAEGEVPGHELGISDDIARVRLLATRAKGARTNDARTEIYGTLLATCAHCHFAIRDR